MPDIPGCIRHALGRCFHIAAVIGIFRADNISNLPKRKTAFTYYNALIIIVLGTCLILRPWEYNSFSVYALFAIASAFTGAVVYTTIHKLFENGGHTSWEVIFYLFLCSVFIGLAMMYNNHHMPTRYEWFLLLA